MNLSCKSGFYARGKDTIMFCPNCGKENPDGAAFCGECGMAFGAPAAAPAAEAPAAEAPAAPVEAAPAPAAEAAPAPEAPAAPAPEAAPEAAPSAAAPVAQPEPKPKDPSAIPFGQHFKNIFKCVAHPITGPAEVIPQYDKIGNALLLTAIIVVICALIGGICSISTFLIDMGIDKLNMRRSTFNDIYSAGYVVGRILKYCFYPFLYYAIKSFGVAGLAMLAGLIVKEKWSFAKLLTAASLALVPAYIVSDFLGSFLSLIPVVRLGSFMYTACYLYYVVMLYEGMAATTKLKDNKKAFVLVAVFAIAFWVANWFSF